MRLLAVTIAACWLCGCSSLGVLLGLKRFEPNRSDPEVERLAKEVMKPPPQSVDELLIQGDRLRDGGDVGQAALSYLKAMRVDPSRHAPGERIGFLHLAKGDFEHAASAFEQVLKTAPDSSTALAGRGLALLRKGELTEARASLQRAVALDPTSELAALAMGLICDWTDQAEEARRHYTRAIELSPVNADAENNLGVSYYLSADYAHAAEHLRRAVDLEPNDPAHQNNLALALSELGRFDEALVAFRAAGGEATAQNNLAYVHQRRGDTALAIRHYELALAAQPANPLPIIRNLRRAEDDLVRSSVPVPAPAPVPAPPTTEPTPPTPEAPTAPTP